MSFFSMERSLQDLSKLITREEESRGHNFFPPWELKVCFKCLSCFQAITFSSFFQLERKNQIIFKVVRFCLVFLFSLYFHHIFYPLFSIRHLIWTYHFFEF
jgi:hypothetical protein